MRDYADACFRYLRATGMVDISYSGRSISIVPERLPDIDYVLSNCDRRPMRVKNQEEYISYLGNPGFPVLLTDDIEAVKRKLRDGFPGESFAEDATADELNGLLDRLTKQRKSDLIDQKVADLKTYRDYTDVQDLFDRILKDKSLYDAPLMLEWNTWRAMTMLDGGDIKANLKFDDFGKPLSTALGNRADIECDYGNFALAVEVTMLNGHKQYDGEGEPVPRHLGRLAAEKGKQAFCLFIAPKINPSVVSHFFVLHRLDIPGYGGAANIIPLPLEIFRKMVEDSYKAKRTPTPTNVRGLFEVAGALALSNKNDVEWYEAVKRAASNWLQL